MFLNIVDQIIEGFLLSLLFLLLLFFCLEVVAWGHLDWTLQANTSLVMVSAPHLLGENIVSIDIVVDQTWKQGLGLNLY